VRKNFEREANAVLIHGGHACDDRVTIPGGWGAAGAPNDAWHQVFHSLRRGYMRCVVGSAGSTKLRKAMQDLNIAIDGNQKVSQCGCI